MESYKSLFSPDLLKGKVAFITGGSRGGMLKEIARGYLLHGAKGVVLMSRNAEKNGEVAKDLSQYGQCLSEPGDVRKPEDCKRAVANTIKALGQIDILVNGAAGNFLASASALSINGFRTVQEIDTLGTFNVSQAVYNGYMKEHGGVIINISATLHWSGSALQVHSAAAKAAIDSMTKTLAVEWGPNKVRVVGIIPGGIEGTEGFARLSDANAMNDKEKANAAFKDGTQSNKATMEQLGKKTVALQRWGSIYDIANTALYLASPIASYVTGTNVLVDGGAVLLYPNMLFTDPKFVDMWSLGKL
ncbi:peroxisomal-dienoyl-reductase [Stylonychia lemnae]|uniref:2,4-dienoyl-CoA reductase [(3E)-enoyl-CoA-producing] n=1 Tax=Stylonychia lemnae TaxID=5949 RepID=A0A078AX33_STYLE|nr:peroxisomal-dienoyl-reductase [Stylonychia lemnae]|eukprot:CDW85812.1 peroxisomal-dienoyl-reductase [Stylonychia lemnae]